jgi:hypothetical protein
VQESLGRGEEVLCDDPWPEPDDERMEIGVNE